MLIISLFLGASLLIWGRKLFWLFIAAAGFLTGWQMAQALAQNEVMGVLTGLLFAIGGALLAIFLKTIAIGIAGFLMGGSVLLGMAGWLGLDQGILAWIIYIIGGIGGAILIGIFFDWVVIILSSLGGASLIINALTLNRPLAALAFIGLFILGIVVQASDRRKKDEKRS